MSKQAPAKARDIVGALPALRRAAKAARELAIRTGTPFYVWKDGKIVNLNPVRRKRARGKGRGKGS